MQEIMYAYIYVKATRNRMNHASDSDNLNPIQLKLFAETLNYNMDYTADAIKSNINITLKPFETLKGQNTI